MSLPWLAAGLYDLEFEYSGGRLTQIGAIRILPPPATRIVGANWIVTLAAFNDSLVLYTKNLDSKDVQVKLDSEWLPTLSIASDFSSKRIGHLAELKVASYEVFINGLLVHQGEITGRG